MKRKYPQWIDEYLNSVENCFRSFAISTVRPIDWSLFHPYYADLMIKKLFQAIKRQKELGISFTELASTFQSPTLVGYELLYALLDAKSAGLKKEERLKLVDFFNNLLKAKCKRDRYLFESSIVHTQKEIKKIYQKTPWRKAIPEISDLLGKITSALYSLVWGLFADAYPNQGREIFGPYKIGRRILLMRTYFNLKNNELWTKAKKFKYNKIIIYSIYKNITIKLNLFNHILTKKNLPFHLVSWAFSVDGKFIKSIDELEELKRYLTRIAIFQYKKLQSLEDLQLNKKFIEMRLHEFRDFFKKLKMDWRPSKEMIRRVRGRKMLPNKFPKFKTISQKLKFWRRLLDPRDDFFIKDYITSDISKRK